jgi:hypothetical protein
MIRRSITKLASGPDKYIGASGTSYSLKELLQERPHLGGVWLATSDILELLCRATQWLIKSY